MSGDAEARAAAENRVHQFLEDYEAKWQKAAPAFEDREAFTDAFTMWRQLMSETTATHFTDDTVVELGGSFRRPAEYSPNELELSRTDVEGDAIYVLMKERAGLEAINEFRLEHRDGAWLIASISQGYDDPTTPYVDESTVANALAQTSASAELITVPDAQAGLNENDNFVERSVTLDGTTTDAVVEQIGTLVTSSGALAVLDFGYGNDDAVPLARTVKPGEYPVDRVVAFGRNAAVRVRFSDATPTTWRAASLPDSGHVIGVDAGCAVIVDYPAYARMTRRAKTAADDAFSRRERPVVLLFAAGSDTGVAFDSGWGDGSYPVYWGVDEAGEVAQLVIDFMVLVDDVDGVLRHL